MDIQAYLRKQKLWKYTQAKMEAESSPSEKAKWEEGVMNAADAMTPTVSAGVKQQLTEEDFNNGYKMLNHITLLLRPAGDVQFMRLTKELYSLRFDNGTPDGAFLSMSDYITRIKILEEQIDATKVEMTKDKRTLLVLMMGLPEYYQSIIQIWSVTPDITAEKAKSMLLDEERRRKDVENPMTLYSKLNQRRKQQPLISAKCSHCHKDRHTAEQCWDLYPLLAPNWVKEKREGKVNARAHTLGLHSQALTL